MELILVRHAEPVRVSPEQTGGAPADPELTAAGHDQAQRCADWLRHEAIDAVLTSPKLRAVQTAAPLAQHLGLDPIVLPDLTEYDADADHYIPMEELRASGDERFTAMITGDWERFGGQSVGEFRARISDVLDTIVANHAGQRVVAFCHGGVVNMALAVVLGLDRHLWFDPVYTSISRLQASRFGARSVSSVNESAHLIAVRGA